MNKVKKCALCHKDTQKLYTCTYCKAKVCKECIVKTKEAGLVCRKCNEDTARQLNWDGFELKI